MASLHAAIQALSTCVESIYDLLEHVDAFAQGEQSASVARRRPRVSYGGGPSPLASFDHHQEERAQRLSAESAAALADAAGLAGRSRAASGAEIGHAASRPDRDSRASGDPRPGSAARLSSDPGLRGFQRPPASGSGRPGAPALMAAADLAHRGYSRDEIAARLRDRWGDEASQILRDLMD